MINLLPPEIKNNYKYARRNTRLRLWVVICLMTLVGLGGLTTYGLLRLHQSTTDYQQQISMTKQLFKKESFAGTQKQVQDISDSLKLAVMVLSKEVLFSELIKQIGASMPNDANLTGLNINQVQGGLSITADATDYKTASQVEVNLSDPANKIFSSADLESITCQSTGTANKAYPCVVIIRALFAQNNPFLFINGKGPS